MGVSDLRVLNDDRIAVGGGFPLHGHRDMEILTYVLSGELRHHDSMGHAGVIRPGEIQMMRAGTGVQHSEANASRTAPLHLLQIWIEPDQTGAAPMYAQQPLDAAALRQGFQAIAGPGHRVPIGQDAHLLASWPQAGTTVSTALNPARVYYLHVATGAVSADGQALQAGDALVLRDETALSLTANQDSQVLLFDLRGDRDAH